jgi:hypothetical protein
MFVLQQKNWIFQLTLEIIADLVFYFILDLYSNQRLPDD